MHLVGDSPLCPPSPSSGRVKGIYVLPREEVLRFVADTIVMKQQGRFATNLNAGVGPKQPREGRKQ